jgi:hypothetical protein
VNICFRTQADKNRVCQLEKRVNAREERKLKGRYRHEAHQENNADPIPDELSERALGDPLFPTWMLGSGVAQTMHCFFEISNCEPSPGSHTEYIKTTRCRESRRSRGKNAFVVLSNLA